MSLPGSWISVTYLFKNKFTAFNKLQNSDEYTITRKRLFLFPCLKILLGHSSNSGLNVTITFQVVVYSPAERAEKLPLFLLYPSLLCGLLSPWFPDAVFKE